MSTSDTTGERFGPDVTGMSHRLVNVRSMTDAQVASYVSGLRKNVTDAALDSSGQHLDSLSVGNWSVTDRSAADFQRFVYDTGANGKPNIVSDQHFRQMDGDTIYRTVKTSSDGTDSAQARADRFMSGEYFATGRGYHGAGSYFADSKSDSKGYGSSKPGHSAMIRAKFNQNAKSVSETSLERMVWKESKTIQKAFGDKSGYGFKNEAAKSIYALWKGYNVISDGAGYYVILDRTAVTVSDQVETW